MRSSSCDACAGQRKNSVVSISSASNFTSAESFRQSTENSNVSGECPKEGDEGCDTTNAQDFSNFDEITNEPISRFNHGHNNDVASSNKTLKEMGFPRDQEACESEDCRADWFLQLGTDIIADRSLKAKKSCKKAEKNVAEGYPSKKVTHPYTQIT